MAQDVEGAAVYAELQNEIYLRGEPSPYPIEWRALEAAARERTTEEAWGYLAGGAGGEETVRANREAFDRWRIVPRMLRGVGARDLATTVLETRMPAPLLDAPVDGVIVSNHGGRQVDGATAALDALPEVAGAVPPDIPVLFDSGIRTG